MLQNNDVPSRAQPKGRAGAPIKTQVESKARSEGSAPGSGPDSIPDSAQAIASTPAQQRRAYLLQGLVALLVLVIAIFAARSLLQTAPSTGARPVVEREARLVQVVSLEPGQYQPQITGWGTLGPSRELTLRAQVSGAVEALSPRLEPGMTVAAGDSLVTLDSAAYQAALTEAQGALAEAEANLALEQGQQAIARREFELLGQSLGGDALASGAGSGSGLALREPQLAIAEAAVAAAEARLAMARLNLERTTLEAPFDAMVADRAVTLGAQVSPGVDIARLIGVERWWVEVLVPAERLAWLDQGSLGSTRGDEGPTPVTLSQPGVWNPGQTHEATLLRVLQELEDQGNLARVLVAVDDPLRREGESAPRLLLGSFLQAEIQGRLLENVFVLEPAWLRENNTVWLMDADNNLQIQPVTVLYRDEDAVVVRAESSGPLQPGARLITSRVSAPAAGMPVRTEAETGTADASLHKPSASAAQAGESSRG